MALITPASPRPTVYNGETATTSIVTAGAAVTAGYVTYQDAADSRKVKHANADDDATSIMHGFMVESGVTDAQLLCVISGPLYFGSAVFTTGEVYYLSSTTGRIGQLADITSGDNVLAVGKAVTPNILWVELDSRIVVKA